jgi:hypothetical protein
MKKSTLTNRKPTFFERLRRCTRGAGDLGSYVLAFGLLATGTAVGASLVDSGVKTASSKIQERTIAGGAGNIGKAGPQ